MTIALQFCTAYLTSEDLRAGIGVLRWDRIVNVNHDAWVGGLVSSGKCHFVRRLRAPTATDHQLATRNIELGTA
jgi:hypothetical protein